MSKEIGTLVVVVLKARNLRDKHTIHKQDAYAQATLNKLTLKTKTDIRGGQNPVWDEELRFPIVKAVSDETRKLEICCYSKEPRQDDLVGRGSVDISETLQTGEFDDWVPLQTEEGHYRGDIFLEMTYYANVPPPQRRPSKWAPADRLKRPATTYSYPDASIGPNGHATPTPNGQAAAHKHDTLPPLPEESAIPVPAFLRPGGGAPKTSPKANTGLLPPDQPAHTHTPPRDPSPTGLVGDSRAHIDFIPPYLRPGGGAPPKTSPKADTGLLPPDHSLHTHAPYSPSHDPSPPAPARNSRASLDYVPPLLRPGGGAPGHAQSSAPVHIPEPQIPTPDIPSYSSAPRYSSPPRAPYSPPRHAYGEFGSPPRGDYGSTYGAPPIYPPQPQIPTSYPQQPYPAQPYPAQPYPAQPYPAQPYSTQSYPPGPPQSYPPYGGSSYQAPPDPDLPDPYLEKRYQTPLPLPPDDDRPGRTPKPSRPQQQASHKHPQTQTQPKTETPPKTEPAKTPKAVHVQQEQGPSREERDRLIALQLEREEEERQRRLREQEERDMELARQLDLELNLEQQAAARAAQGEGASGAGGAPAPSSGTSPAAHMPGGW